MSINQIKKTSPVSRLGSDHVVVEHVNNRNIPTRRCADIPLPKVTVKSPNPASSESDVDSNDGGIVGIPNPFSLESISFFNSYSSGCDSPEKTPVS